MLRLRTLALLLTILFTAATLTACGSGAPTENGEGSARLACDVIAEVPTGGFTMGRRAAVPLGKLGVASSAAMLAGDQDPQYKRLATAFSRLRGSVYTYYKARGPRWRKARAAVGRACAGL